MKTTRSLLSSLVVFGVAVGMISSLAAETVSQVSAKVVRVKGQARYMVGGGAWQTVKKGDLLGAGTIIETGVGAQVDVIVGEGAPMNQRPIAGEMLTYAPSAEQNMVRLWENSRLGIDKLTVTETGSDVVTDTKLDLQAGHIFGSVKKMSAASTYEVKIPNGVAGIRGTVYDISVEGIIKVLVGSVYLAYVDSNGNSKTQVVMGEQMFNMRTGVLQALPNMDRTGMLAVVRQIPRAVTPVPQALDTTIYNVVSPD
jgi:hypothetical protein